MVIIIYKFVIPEGNAGVEVSEANPEYMGVFNITIQWYWIDFPGEHEGLSLYYNEHGVYPDW